MEIGCAYFNCRYRHRRFECRRHRIFENRFRDFNFAYFICWCNLIYDRNRCYIGNRLQCYFGRNPIVWCNVGIIRCIYVCFGKFICCYVGRCRRWFFFDELCVVGFRWRYNDMDFWNVISYRIFDCRF